MLLKGTSDHPCATPGASTGAVASCQGPAALAERASPWVRRWSHLVPAGGQVLDVACGEGRHLAWFAGRGHPVVGVDRSAPVPAALGLAPGLCELVQADIEQGPWPFQGRQFQAVVVTHYLWRPLFETLAQSVAEGGVLIYETFARGQETVGRPSRPEFLLNPGELFSAFAGLRVVAYEDGFLSADAFGADRFVQRLVALRPPPQEGGPPGRHRLA